MLLDKSLDGTSKIIASRSTQMRRAPRRAGRRIVRGRITGRLNGRVGGRAGRVGTRRLRGIVSSTAAAIQAVIDEGSKIIVSNLTDVHQPSDVTEAQIKDLFSNSIGPTRRCFLSYGPNGQSKGIATVIFQRKADAGRAYKKYEGKVIDGTRKLKIEIVLDPKMSLAASSLSQRVTSELPRTRRTGALRRAGRFRSSRPRKTAEELDAEMIGNSSPFPAPPHPADYFGSANQEPAT
ncbi:uncharacterized protein T551_00776 [Pneumocystis jirovecii RU7]|uniref:RRM domain-containing protein n=1 Tax=Pneumocystis jirovecii (strain RU7) TaxID=1408657 RepID=A0A0W4ZUN6_PNEJ7|nr:uncharacterized protein T551_00776 [Pneumocystis jirovecii RU7]KTW32094.1 hypothetical protein T551_00776 [Pneumocystis jirovecii RU7]